MMYFHYGKYFSRFIFLFLKLGGRSLYHSHAIYFGIFFAKKSNSLSHSDMLSIVHLYVALVCAIDNLPPSLHNLPL